MATLVATATCLSASSTGLRRAPSSAAAYLGGMPKPPVPAEVAEFLERPNYATISVVRPDGQPVSYPTWYLFEDGQIVVNMDGGRKRIKHLRRDPRVALSAMDPTTGSRTSASSGTWPSGSPTRTWRTSTGSAGTTPATTTHRGTGPV